MTAIKLPHLAILLFSTLFLSSGTAFADSPAEAADASAAAQPAPEPAPEPAREDAGEVEPSAVSWGGLWIFLDPLTGEVLARPTAEQAAWRSSQRQQREWLNKSSEGLVPFALEDGGRGVNLKGRFRHSLVVTVTDSGDFVTTCSDHPTLPAGHTHGEADHSADDKAPVR